MALVSSSLMQPGTQEVSAGDRTARLRSISELAAEWGVRRNTIHALVRRGELHAVRVGNRIRFRPEDVDAYLEACEVAAG
jgi:excisionase family DNA binding protein